VEEIPQLINPSNLSTPHALCITPRISEMSASTSRIWIIPAALYTKKPTSQPMTSITATRYKRLLIQ